MTAAPEPEGGWDTTGSPGDLYGPPPDPVELDEETKQFCAEEAWWKRYEDHQEGGTT